MDDPPGVAVSTPRRGWIPRHPAVERWAVPATLAAVVLLAWGPMGRGGLVSDDWVWRERARSGVVMEPGQFFRPACWCSWWVQKDMPPVLLHGADLVIHWICAWQVAGIVPALGGTWAAGTAAASVFAALPVLHEAVCWPSARCGPMAAACVMAAVASVLNRRKPLLAVALLGMALTAQESAATLMWGIPMVLLAAGRKRDAGLWCMILFVLTAGYWGTVRAVDAHTRLAGGYAAPFRMDRAMSHLGTYLGMMVGLPASAAWWPLWPALGLAAMAVGIWKRTWIVGAAWAWSSVAMMPFLRLGGPVQPRFLYVMLVPVVAGIGWLLSGVRQPLVQRFLPALGLVAAISIAPGAREASREWVAAGRRVAWVVDHAAASFPVDRAVIAVNPPEFHGRAHLLRNGLFPALRLTTGRPYRGLTIPPSEAVRTCGQLREWLQRQAPGYLSDARGEAWLFRADRPYPLRGWQEDSASPRRLSVMCEDG